MSAWSGPLDRCDQTPVAEAAWFGNGVTDYGGEEERLPGLASVTAAPMEVLYLWGVGDALKLG